MMINYRIMDINDYEEVYALWQSTDNIVDIESDSKPVIQNFLERNPKTSIVAIENNKIVGIILCGHDGRRGYIYRTAVVKSYMGQGIGRELVNQAVDALKNEGINKAAIMVFRDNKGGNAFWDKMGFDIRNEVVYRTKRL